MQGTKKAQLAAALAATLGFALHGAANAADKSDSAETKNQKPLTIAKGTDSNCSGTDKKGKPSKCSGKQAGCSGTKGKSSKCSGKQAGCSGTKGKSSTCSGSK